MSRQHTILRVLALPVAALTTVLMGCSGGGEPAAGDGPDPKPAAWPQPVAGKLTTEMCDLLGPDDYRELGALAATYDERKLVPQSGPNFLSCHSAGQNWLTLNLQPDAVSAELYYRAQLSGLRKEKPAQLKEGVLPGADDSYFAASGPDADSRDLVARRGGLIVGVSIGFLNDHTDQLAVVTGLAKRVFERVPDVGTVDTGEPHHIVLTITGNPARTGPVDVTYLDPITHEMVKEQGRTLPWVKKLDAPWFGPSRTVNVLAVPRKPVINNFLTCRITVDGKEADSSTTVGAPLCSGESNG
jgi:hypothetical protein